MFRGSEQFAGRSSNIRKRYAMEKEKLTTWMKTVPKSELDPTQALARYLKERLKGRGTRVNLDNLVNRLPNIASFVRAVFSEKRRRDEKPAKRVAEGAKRVKKVKPDAV
jgi:hypothetical protein